MCAGIAPSPTASRRQLRADSAPITRCAGFEPGAADSARFAERRREPGLIRSRDPPRLGATGMAAGGRALGPSHRLSRCPCVGLLAVSREGEELVVAAAEAEVGVARAPVDAA